MRLSDDHLTGIFHGAIERRQSLERRTPLWDLIFRVKFMLRKIFWIQMKAVSYYFSYFYEIFAKLKYNFIETKEETKNEFQNFRKEILIDLQANFFRSIIQRSHLWCQAWWSGPCLNVHLHVLSYYLVHIIWTILCTTLCYLLSNGIFWISSRNILDSKDKTAFYYDNLQI